MKSYVWLQTADGSIHQVEEEVAMFCLQEELLQKGMGSSKLNAIVLPERVNTATLGLILDYCRFHQMPDHSIKERKAFDDKFIRMDTKILCELTSAADSLQLRPLIDLMSRTLARKVQGKTAEEIRAIFNLPDDLTEEEKLEHMKNVNNNPRLRLRNLLNARKREELKEREQKKNMEAEDEAIEERSVDDLLSFINGEEKESKGAKSGRTKKKNRQKKTHIQMCSNNAIADYNEASDMSHLCKNGKADGMVLDSGPSSGLMDPLSLFSSKLNFDDGDIDDELDPATKEELDREVEDFARRLNSDWPERMQEIFSLGQGRRLASIAINGDETTQRYTTC